MAKPPTNFFAVFKDPTYGIQLVWTPPSPLGDTTGYRISFTGGNSSGHVNISGGDSNNYTLTGLLMGFSYDISIVALSQHLPSEAVKLQLILSEKEMPLYFVYCYTLFIFDYLVTPDLSSASSIMATSISLSWSNEFTNTRPTNTNYTVEDFNSTSIHRINVRATGTDRHLLLTIATGKL